MTSEQYVTIINPICRQCSNLSFRCQGFTIKDWVKAKNCTMWEFGYPNDHIVESLNLEDYLIGADLSKTDKQILDNI